MVAEGRDGQMNSDKMKPTGNRIAVIFVSQRNQDDEAGYSAAAEAMERLAEEQPGYAGIISARGSDGLGISVSYWDSADAAKAWRAHPAHREVRIEGRNRWYDSYHIDIAEVQRSYAWARDGEVRGTETPDAA